MVFFPGDAGCEVNGTARFAGHCSLLRKEAELRRAF